MTCKIIIITLGRILSTRNITTTQLKATITRDHIKFSPSGWKGYATYYFIRKEATKRSGPLLYSLIRTHVSSMYCNQLSILSLAYGHNVKLAISHTATFTFTYSICPNWFWLILPVVLWNPEVDFQDMCVKMRSKAAM